MATSTLFLRLTGWLWRVSFLFFISEKSRMSFIRLARRRPLCMIILCVFAWAWLRGPSAPESRDLLSPIIPWIGVRSSWDVFARNASLSFSALCRLFIASVWAASFSFFKKLIWSASARDKRNIIIMEPIWTHQWVKKLKGTRWYKRRSLTKQESKKILIARVKKRAAAWPLDKTVKLLANIKKIVMMVQLAVSLIAIA